MTCRKRRGHFLAGLAFLVLAGCAGLVREQIYQPVPVAETPVTFAGEAPQAVSVTTADGLQLSGYYWPADPGNDTLLIYFHGNGGNQFAAAGSVEPFHRDGHGVLVASYRSYGGNPGKPTEAGLFADGDAWIAKAHTLAPDSRVFLFGHSLGGAVALEMASQHPVSGVATLGAFTRLADVAPTYARGVLPDRFDNLQAIGRVKAPVFLFHGTQDETVPFSAAERLQDASTDGSAIVVPLEGGGHHVSMEKLSPYVWEKLLNAPD